jgi:hypothetical protein
VVQWGLTLGNLTCAGLPDVGIPAYEQRPLLQPRAGVAVCLLHGRRHGRRGPAAARAGEAPGAVDRQAALLHAHPPQLPYPVRPSPYPHSSACIPLYCMQAALCHAHPAQLPHPVEPLTLLPQPLHASSSVACKQLLSVLSRSDSLTRGVPCSISDPLHPCPAAITSENAPCECLLLPLQIRLNSAAVLSLACLGSCQRL